jgi:hypothetical protein
MPSRRGRVLRLSLAAAVTLAAAAPVADAQLPDLDQEAPAELTVAYAPSQLAQLGPAWRPLRRGPSPRWWLGFSSAVSNVGTAPLTIVGHRASTTDAAMTADQVVAGTTVPAVGELRFTRSPDHQHWHLVRFERYALRRAGSARRLVTDRKSGFCLGDRYPVRARLPGAPPRPVITGRCGLRGPSLLQVTEGISVGYGDVYHAYLEYQDLPLDGLRAGRYVLVHSVDAGRQLHEASRANNSASVLLDLRWHAGAPKVRTVRVCPQSGRCDVPLAHATGFVPNDPGTTSRAGGWSELQWNFAGRFGVDAPGAWTNAITAGRPGGKGVTVAVLDTGVSYTDRAGARRSPDLSARQFVRGYDFVDDDPYPTDPNGHGTFIASTVAEKTGNGYALTGLAYGARIMPVRVLDAYGDGDPGAIARGIRFAAAHRADIINLSLNFAPGVTPRQVAPVARAIGFARRRGAVIVAATGNDDARGLPYPASDSRVLAVGATTEHGCVANYSNQGPGIDLVAPGGGEDADEPGDANCVAGRAGRSIAQLTLSARGPDRFASGRGARDRDGRVRTTTVAACGDAAAQANRARSRSAR